MNDKRGAWQVVWLLTIVSWIGAGGLMDFKILEVLFIRPRQGVHFRQYDIPVCHYLDIFSELFLHFLNQLKVKLRWMNCLRVRTANKPDSPGFLIALCILS